MTSTEVARILLRRKAVLLRPRQLFTWASGIKAPIYTDNRKLISTVKERDYIVNELSRIIKKERCDLIAGTATAGIPWAAFVAQKLKKPMIYVRAKPKDHGTSSTIEGELKKGQKVVVVEDLISTGQSSLYTVSEIKRAGGKVLVCVALFTYGFKVAREDFESHHVKLQTLTDIEFLLREAVKGKYIKKSDLSLVQSWRKQFS